MTAEPQPADPGEFTCATCGGTFPKEWTDEEAAAEVETVFGVQHQEDDAVVCDDCYKALTEPAELERFKREGPAR